MGLLLYNAGIGFVRAAYWLASLVHPKAKAFREGRIQQTDRLQQTFPLRENHPLAWFHCSSLGEFEQGRPVMEALKSSHPNVKILLTFFSPSGYEVRKNYTGADYIFYLPWDTASNARWFVTEVRPAFAVFVKYEFWFYYSRALRTNRIPLISISAIFRPTHVYFKPQGFIFRAILRNFTYFFVQNNESLKLLKSIGITAASVAGDTRFDRVNQIVTQSGENSVARGFKSGHRVMVIGSAWPDDMAVLLPFMNAQRGSLRFIVAPHEISESFMQAIEAGFSGKSVRYTKTSEQLALDADLLIVDTIGLLAQLYRYGEYAFVGGGYKEGLHNTLEAACYGIPVFFGSKAPYDKYQEAVDLVARGGAFAVANTPALTAAYEQLTVDKEKYQHAVAVTRAYVASNLGATRVIMDYLNKILQSWKGV